MTELQIVLLIVGAVIFIVSFFLPGGKQGDSPVEEVSKEQARQAVDREIDDAKMRINEIVDETISYAMEKSERAMDRISNEKMLAFGEYSDTVLSEIHKNHQEAVFLYDMLNHKHEALTEASARIVAVSSPVATAGAEAAGDKAEPEESFGSLAAAHAVKVKAGNKRILEEAQTAEPVSVPGVEVAADFDGSDGAEAPRNSNDVILEMHKEGKSNIDIARSLGLGISEVKLVIDLFED